MKKKMKCFCVKPWMIALAIISALPAAAQKNNAAPKKWVTVSGKIQFLWPEEDCKRLGYNLNKVYIGKGEGYEYKAFDSVTVKPDGSYSIKINATVPTIYRIDLLKYCNRVDFFADANAEINDRGYDTAKVKIKNPPYVFIKSQSLNNKIINIINHIDYYGYQESIFVYNEEYYANQYKNTDSAWATYLAKQDRINKFQQMESARMRLVIDNYADQPAVVSALRRTNWMKDADNTLAILDKLSAKYPWFRDAKDMKEEVKTFLVRTKMLENGKPAPTFTYPDPNGKNVSLASYKGKYVLIDFWASWCGPCRQAIPKVKDLYEQYRSKGFEVLGVSIDNDKKAWLKAVEEEEAPWAQVLTPDIRKTQTDYMFSGIPTMYLIDGEGKIVDKFTGFTQEAEARLKEILNKL
ncbi:MAG: TlpA family protein disulfide reductase [Chitinophagaceae bacterium]|nr:TlpA family protein disulfide reductase [Chitinophagaceae bacterium]